MNTTRIVSSLVIPLCIAAPLSTARAGESVWNRTVSGAGNWNQASNWSDGIPGAGDTAIFRKNAAATLNANISIGAWRSGDPTDGTGNTAHVQIRAGSGSILTIGTETTGGLMNIAAPSGEGSAASKVTIENGVTVNVIGGQLLLATQEVDSERGNARTGGIYLSLGSFLNLGTQTSRTEAHIGRQNTIGTFTSNNVNSGIIATTAANGAPATAGGNLTGYFSDLTVGTTTSVPYKITGNRGEGVVDLTGFQSALIDANRFIVGRADNGSATGDVKLDAFQLKVHQSFQLGVAGASDAGAPEPVDTKSNVSGTLDWKAGANIAIGSASAAASTEIGVSHASRGNDIEVIGSATGTGGTFSGHFSQLTIGSQNATVGGKTYLAKGTFDLRNTVVTHFEVADTLVIGHGSGAGSQGSLYLADTQATVGGEVFIGDSDLVSGVQPASSGLLDLDQTLMSVGSNVYIGLTGTVSVTVGDGNAGLLLTNSASILDLAVEASYAITFESDAAGSYGLAWKGNRQLALEAMVQDGQISWTNLTGQSVEIYYDLAGDYTYIRAIPEPSTVALGVFSATFFVLADRLRRRSVI